jgi:hypothetical protein
MAFVNERITEDDLERYRILEIERRIVPGYYSSSSTCTIDHDREARYEAAREVMHRTKDHRDEKPRPIIHNRPTY